MENLAAAVNNEWMKEMRKIEDINKLAKKNLNLQIKYRLKIMELNLKITKCFVLEKFWSVCAYLAHKNHNRLCKKLEKAYNRRDRL